MPNVREIGMLLDHISQLCWPMTQRAFFCGMDEYLQPSETVAVRPLSLHKKILLGIALRAPLWCCHLLRCFPGIRRAALSRLQEQPSVDSQLIVHMEPCTHAPYDPLMLFPAAAPVSRVLCERADLGHHRRYAVLAHWDPQGMVDPYVLYLARAIQELGYALILVSDSIHTATNEAVFVAELQRESPGYDFASWRVAFETYPFLFEADEVLLLNDSIFGPIWPLAPVHERMNSLKCDWWGLSESEDPCLHMQSYYLVFHRAVLESPLFHQFWQTVGNETDRDTVLMKYEIGLSRQLHNGILRCGAYVSPEQFTRVCSTKRRPYTPLYMYWRTLIRRFQFPVIKRDILLGKHPWNSIYGWRRELAETGYPVDLIDAYFKRVGGSSTSQHEKPCRPLC